MTGLAAWLVLTQLSLEVSRLCCLLVETRLLVEAVEAGAPWHPRSMELI